MVGLVRAPLVEAQSSYLYAVNTGAYIGAAGLIPGATFTPAAPGEILTIYGVSFGPTNPATVPGTPPSGAAQSVYTAVVTLGTATLNGSAVFYAGVSPGTAGLYQLNIQIPGPTLTLGSRAAGRGCRAIPTRK